MGLSASEPNNAQNNEQKLTNQRSSFLTIKQKAKKLKVCNLRSGTKGKKQRENVFNKKGFSLLLTANKCSIFTLYHLQL